MNILISWEEQYSVHVKEIDQQHKKLFDMVNIIYDSILMERDDDVLEQIIKDMKDYAFIHFKTEESYFTKLKYKDTPSHIKEHQYFIKQAENFANEYKGKDPSLKLKILIFLKDWLMEHILVTDKNYEASFQNAGIS